MLTWAGRSWRNWSWTDLKPCEVCSQAYRRGCGSPDEMWQRMPTRASVKAWVERPAVSSRACSTSKRERKVPVEGIARRGTSVRLHTVPGLYNSGPGHWQTLWEQQLPQCQRILQADWSTASCSDWVAQIDRIVSAGVMSEIVLLAHSLGCATVAHWSKLFHRAIRGALLVAPSDVEAPTYPSGTTGFAPMALERLAFPSIVVASNDDPYVSVARAQYFAECWGSEFFEVGCAGHINASSELGMWEQGMKLVERLLA